MKELSEVVVTLEGKVENLVREYKKIQTKNEELFNLVDELQGKLKEKNAEIVHLREKYQLTKVASALSGSDEGVRETKLKINRLVREIDSCIALMQG
jgi:glycerol-3-phosphate responsive antiterminator